MSDKLTATPVVEEFEELVGGALKFRVPSPAHLTVVDLEKLPAAVRERFQHFVRYYRWAPPNVGQWYSDHAHSDGQEILLCTHGVVEFWIADGIGGEQQFSVSSGEAVFIPVQVWHKVRILNVDGELAVLADMAYGRETYVENYELFKTLREHAAAEAGIKTLSEASLKAFTENK